MKKVFVLCSLIMFSCDSYQNSKDQFTLTKTIESVTLLGDTLNSPEVKEGKSFDQFKSAKLNYLDNQDNPEALIWYGRRVAYLGYFKEAIKIFTLGIEIFPDDARFYRHRGHRYISIRQYDSAIKDFEKAVELIYQEVDRIEPDGLPNSKNIPLTTLHGNIWYHLGLAYYLKNDMNSALKAFSDRSVTHKYDDNIVSSSHWLYMIYRRLNKIEESKKVVENVNENMDIIENMSYHQTSLFHKGVIQESEIKVDEVSLYSLANWYMYEKNDSLKAREYYEKLLEIGNPYSFAYIAGEADFVRFFK